MIFNKAYLIAVFTFVVAISSCTHEEPELFDFSNNGIYFDYDDKEEFTSNLNFATHIVNPIEYIKLDLKVKLLGSIANHERQVLLVGKAIEGYEEAKTSTLPETITFAAGEYEKTVKVCVYRPENEEKTYALSLRFSPISSDIGTGIEGKELYNIYTSCTYSEPQTWKENEVYNFFGEWTKEKHIFLARDIYSNDNYVDYTADQLGGGYNSALDYLRNNREDLNYDIPYYYNESLSIFKFSQPDYWTELHDLYLDNFTSRPYQAGFTFLQIAEAEGLTTKTDKAYFKGDEAHLQQLNKRAVEIMQDVYDEFYMKEIYSTIYSTKFQVPLFEDFDYNLREPYCWSTYAPEGKALLDTYYGTYSKEKFAFMINTLLKTNSPHANLAHMFPISRTWDSKTNNYKVNLDRHPKDNTNNSYYSGKEILTTLNRIFREADTENLYNFPLISE